MEYVRYVQLLRRYALATAIVVVIGTAANALFTLRQPKVYKATATLLLNPAAPNQAIPYLGTAAATSNGQSVTEQLASTYDIYLKTSTFDALVASALKLPESPDALAGQLSSGLEGTTNFYQISATANVPAEAARIANGVSAQFIEQNLKLQRQAQQDASRAGNQQLLDYLQHQINAARALDQKLSARNDPSTAAQTQLGAVEQRLSSLTATYNQVEHAAPSEQALNTAALAAPARIPTVPIAPKVKQNIIIGALVSLVLALAMAVALDYLDSSVRTPEDTERTTGQLPLAVIGLIGERKHARRRRRLAASNGHLPPAGVAGTGAEPAGISLFTIEHPHDPISEAFRTLRTNLAFSTLGQAARSLVVTSLQPSEGKTTVAANLAVVLAQSGKRVILVDTDLRRPTQHQVFHLDRRHGFTELLLGQATIGEALRDTAVPGLRVLPCGTLPPNPAELLSYEAMAPLIARLQAEADLLIFDSPPMGVLSDAVVLSTRVEGTLLVVKSGAIRPQVLTKGLERLRKVGARPLGVALNMVTASAMGEYSYYYYYSYAQRNSEVVGVQG